MQRDISIVDLPSKQKLIIACDSSGGIGPKARDQVSVSGEIVGKLGVRVALMEVLAVRATPIAVVNTLTVEYEPTGKEIISGIKQELEMLDLDVDKVLNGSTEENILTGETGVGITVIGISNTEDLRLANSRAGDILTAIGIPKVGEDVLDSKEEVIDLDTMKKLIKLNYIYDILPVGSKGIKYEAELLADMNNLNLDLVETDIDLQKSAGPSTVLLVTLPKNRMTDLQKVIYKPINLIGSLYSIT
ncbi:AIR synthase related protein [Selenihalanaerobacter shriftii]|uniref:Alpha-ribazole kinase n=1 Tax=Selenihalanaerobacter shriftii TaxID=142842 RepID=A0A1T4K0D1_9FIRM|nr:AIR synthase related protein [Selenihalanaerobacter shriftii]SJZ35834.1 alpha-ribazole kinase [Selenihalanaerobacter shriftii]